MCVVRVEVDSLYAQQLLKGATDTTQQVAMESRLLDVLLRFAARRIIEQIRAGTLPTERTLDLQQVQVEEQDLALLRSMLGAKTCEYQLRDGRDLLCSAAARNDETVVGSMGRHRVAPTSTAACLACQLPDTDVVCSRLLHPAVVGAGPTMGGDFNPVRTLLGAACDLGRRRFKSQTDAARAATDAGSGSLSLSWKLPRSLRRTRWGRHSTSSTPSGSCTSSARCCGFAASRAMGGSRCRAATAASSTTP